MLFKMSELKYTPDPVLEKALDLLFILHADHEQNCSTTAVRAIGSSQPDPYSAIAGGIAALYGPLHGGANEAVLFFFQAEDGIRDADVTGVQTCALPIYAAPYICTICASALKKMPM